MRIAFTTTALLLLAAAGAPAAEDPGPAPAPAPAKPLPIPHRPDPAYPSLDALLATPEEMPPGIRAVLGTPTASPAPRAFFDRDSVRDLLPPDQVSRFPGEFWERVPARRGKTYQALASEGGVPGTVFVVAYADDPGDPLRDFLRGYLWGDAGRPTAEHPDEFQVHGRFLFLLSFPRGDPAAEWFKERLRRKFRIPMLRTRTEFDDLGPALAEAFGRRDADAGLRILDASVDRVADWAFGWHLRAAFSLAKKDWEGAERAALRSLGLDASLQDPLSEDIVWADLEALGNARLERGETEGALAALVRARAFAAGRAPGSTEVSRSDYDLARAFARAERWQECLGALRSAVGGDPRWREIAARDGSFAGARHLPSFRDLLGE